MRFETADIGPELTKFNDEISTAIIYQIVGEISEKDIIEINNINTKTNKIKNRFKKIEERGFAIKFDRFYSEMLEANLRIIDSKMPEILSELVFYYYSGNGSRICELIKMIKNKNPLNITPSYGSNFYEIKIKSFLMAVALGMNPHEKWNGNFDSSVGYRILKENGESINFNIYREDELQDYLLNNTRFDSSNNNNKMYSMIYKEGEDSFLSLNFQIKLT